MFIVNFKEVLIGKSFQDLEDMIWIDVGGNVVSIYKDSKSAVCRKR